ncbi:MAG: lytic transglycosylase domain-containing protein, partial [Gemmatimonadota bacterium]
MTGFSSRWKRGRAGVLVGALALASMGAFALGDGGTRAGDGVAVSSSTAAGSTAAGSRFEAGLEATGRDAASKTGVQLRASAFDAGEWDLPNLDHERVDYWVARFDTVPEMREKFEGFLERSGRYVPMISRKLAERGMPQDLIFLAMIESGFEPTAYSHAQASGLWQFIAATGQRYGLDIDRAVDERRDPVRATDAALDYLEDLYDRFGSWYLAAASYNTGEGRVGRIMRREFGTERATGEEAYYRIWRHLPRETRDYVPLMIAAGRIARDAEQYGFAHVVLESPGAYEEIVVKPATPLIEIARGAGTTVEAIRELNPHFKIHRTPNNRDYPVRVPVGTAERLAHL